MIRLDVGDELVAHVWSFTDKMADDPYSIILKPGAKPRLICTCDSFTYSGGRTCKHITILRQEVKDKSLLRDERFKVSEFGIKHFRLEK